MDTPFYEIKATSALKNTADKQVGIFVDSSMHSHMRTIHLSFWYNSKQQSVS